MNISFIGLGIMGSRMAANLLKTDNTLRVYNRSRDKMDALARRGAIASSSLQEAVADADVVFTMLSTPEAVSETAFGAEGFLGKMKNGAIWADCTTVNPAFSKEAARKASLHGVRFIDAPVSGTKGPAENAGLVFLAGGNKSDIDEIMPLLESMGKKVVFTGGNGMGSSMKMVVNLLLGQSMAAFCEAVSLGLALGADKELLFSTLRDLPVTSPFLITKSHKVEHRDYEPEFPLQWMYKDLHLAAICAYENNIALPVLNAVKELYALAKMNGSAELDLTAIFEVLMPTNKE